MNMIDNLARWQLWGSMGNRRKRPTLIDGIWGDIQYYILGIKNRSLPSVGDVLLHWAGDRIRSLLGYTPPTAAQLPQGFPEKIFATVERVVNARGGWASTGEDACPLFWVDRGRCSVTPFSYIVGVGYELSTDPGKTAAWEGAIEDQLAAAGYDLNIRIGFKPLRIEIDRRDVPTMKLADYWAEISKLPTNENLCAPGVALTGGAVGLYQYRLKNDQLSNLIVGAPGSGKTQLTLSVILSLCYLNGPQHMSLLIIDPKVVDWLPLKSLPHLAAPIATTGRRGLELINALVDEMESRMRLAEQGLRVADMKLIILYVDEMADLLDGLSKPQAEQVTLGIKRLSQTGRGLRIGVIGATQRVYDLPAAIYSKLNTRFVGRTATANDGAAVAGEGVRTNRLPGRGAFEVYPGAKRIQGFFAADQDGTDYAGELGRFATDILARWAGQGPHWTPQRVDVATVATDDAGGATGADQAGPVDEFLELALAAYLADPQGFTQRELRRLRKAETGKQISGATAARLWAELMSYGRAKFNRLG